MPSTPRSTRRQPNRGANTPGEESVVSTASSKAPGVPWNIKKSLAQELENKFPLCYCPGDTNSCHSLIASSTGSQPLAFFLDDLIAKDPDNFSHFGARGSDIRSRIGDLFQHWKRKEKEEYRQRVVQRHRVTQVSARKAPTTQRQAVLEVEDEDFSDLSGDDSVLGSTPKKAAAAKANTASATKKEAVRSFHRSYQAKTNMSSNFKDLDDGTLEGMASLSR